MSTPKHFGCQERRHAMQVRLGASRISPVGAPIPEAHDRCAGPVRLERHIAIPVHSIRVYRLILQGFWAWPSRCHSVEISFRQLRFSGQHDLEGALSVYFVGLAVWLTRGQGLQI